MIWTGLAMSPAVTSVVPFAVTAFGGQQTARTIHFFVACSLVLFLLVHVAMVWPGGLSAPHASHDHRARIGRAPALANGGFPGES